MATSVTGRESHSSRRGKPLNVEYNLVPFIDLLSCCIAFLLMTAVWTQISLVRTNEGTSGVPSTKKDDFTLALYIYKDRLDLAMDGGRAVSVKNDPSGYNLPRLAEQLIAVKSRHPSKQDILILAQDKVLYKDLVSTMDRSIESGFPNITVSGMLE